MIKKQKGQAMTEFVIIIPAMLLLFTGIYQFALISIDRIKLAMVEREIMMFLTEEDVKGDNWKLFGMEMAEKIGLNGQKTGISSGESTSNDTMKSTEGNIGPLAAFSGVEIKVTYNHELIPVFKAITGKKTILLETKLVSAAGGCMKIELKKGITEVFGKVPGSDKSIDEFRQKYNEKQKNESAGNI